MTTHLPRYKDATRPVPERVQDLLGRMNLDEKIAQMHALWLVLKDDGRHEPRPCEIAVNTDDPFDIKRALQQGLGQISRAMGTHSVSADAGLRALNQLQRFLRDETRLGIPALSHEECLLGIMTRDGTLFPSALAYSTTWNPALIAQVGEQIGLECRELGCQQGLAPVLDVLRDLRWGRVEETFGEDPYLVGVFATRYVRGLQGESRDVLATLKHFVAHSASEGGRNHAPVSMGWRELNDVFLLPFEMAVKQANPGSVMPAYHDIDGEPCHSSRHLLTEVLRDQWGFDGIVVADYAGIALLSQHHAVARDAAEAAAMAFNAGLDVELPDNACATHLRSAMERKLISPEKVDEIVARILTEKFRVGLFENTFADRPVTLRKAPAVHTALEVARQAIVILENNGILPLTPDSKAKTHPNPDASNRIAVIGPTADDPFALLSGYSFPVQVILQESVDTTAFIVTPLQALRATYGAANVSYAQGCAIFEERAFGAPVFPGDASAMSKLSGGISGVATRTDLIADAVKAARAAELAIVFVGDLAGLFQTGTVGEGSDTDTLSLPGVQQQLLQAVVATGTPTVVVMTGARPYHLGGLEEGVAAFVMAFAGGQEGGKAIADILSGAHEPSGRLTFSVPKSMGATPCVYNHKYKSSGSPVALHFGSRYPFGHGLSYTRFEYSHLHLRQPQIAIDTGDVELSVTLTNVGERTGSDVVQLYIRDRHASVVRPVLELKAFQKLTLGAGETATVHFTIPVDMLNLTDHSGQRVVEPGWFDLLVGPSSANLPLRSAVEVLGAATRVLPRNWRMESHGEVT